MTKRQHSIPDSVGSPSSSEGGDAGSPDAHAPLAKRRKGASAAMASTTPSSVISEKERRKTARKERNRISAQASRDRKRQERDGIEARLQEVEARNQALEAENQRLRLETAKTVLLETQLDGLRQRFEELERRFSNPITSTASPPAPVIENLALKQEDIVDASERQQSVTELGEVSRDSNATHATDPLSGSVASVANNGIDAYSDYSPQHVDSLIKDLLSSTASSSAPLPPVSSDLPPLSLPFAAATAEHSHHINKPFVDDNSLFLLPSSASAKTDAETYGEGYFGSHNGQDASTEKEQENTAGVAFDAWINDLESLTSPSAASTMTDGGEYDGSDLDFSSFIEALGNGENAQQDQDCQQTNDLLFGFSYESLMASSRGHYASTPYIAT